jgi:hypothetical protein
VAHPAWQVSLTPHSLPYDQKRESLEARVGFEPTNGGFADQSWFSILLVRLAFTPAQLADFGPDLGPIVPKLFPIG